MAPLLRLTPVLAALAIAGCGGDESDSGAGPLDNALGYLPESAPLVVAIDTDVEGSQIKSIGKLLDKFPFASQVERQLQQRLESGDIDYENDLKPLLGNEFVVGATDAQAVVNRGDGNDEFIGAVQVKDKGKLEDAIEKEGAEGEGRHGRRQGLRGRRRRRLRDRGRRAGGGQHRASSSTTRSSSATPTTG